MTEDALERLKNIRDRTDSVKVPPRDPAGSDRNGTTSAAPGADTPPDLAALSLSVSHSESVSDSPDEDEVLTKRMPLEIEVSLWHDITDTCKSLEVGKDVFFEALFLYYQRHRSQLHSVEEEARQRRSRRVLSGTLKRIRSLQQKYH